MGSSTYIGVHVPCTAVAFHKEGKFNFTPCHSVYSKSYWLIFVRASRDVFQHSKSSFNMVQCVCYIFKENYKNKKAYSRSSSSSSRPNPKSFSKSS